MALSVDQVYLLNCLSYMNDEGVAHIVEGESLQSYCQRLLNSDSLIDSMAEEGMRPAHEMKEICNRIINDPALAQMQVAATNRVEGGAFSFVAITPDKGEAVVCFQGTVGDREWADNAKGGSVVSTPEQERALEWYQRMQEQYLNQCGTVTLTGHSKGGNKAKYITLVDKNNSVDRCISFDGQGFSDEFMREYRDEIAARQDKITNYSNTNDYVNILLNDVGERHYIKADKDVSLLEYGDHHSLFSLTDAYPIEDHLTVQNPIMAALDNALNSYLRSLPHWQKDATMDTIADLLVLVFGKDKDGVAWTVLRSGVVIGDFIEHLVKYSLVDAVMGEFLSWLKEVFPALTPIIDSAIWLSNLGLLPGIRPDGDDIHYASTGGSGGANKVRVDTDALESMAQQLRGLSRELASCAQQLRSTAGGCMDSIAHHQIGFGIGAVLIRGLRVAIEGATDATIRRMAKSADQISERCSSLASALQEVATAFEETENRMVGMLE